MDGGEVVVAATEARWSSRGVKVILVATTHLYSGTFMRFSISHLTDDIKGHEKYTW